MLSHLQDRFVTSILTAQQTLRRNERNVVPQTVWNRLLEVVIRCRRAYKGIILRGQHRAARLVWARRYIQFTRTD